MEVRHNSIPENLFQRNTEKNRNQRNYNQLIRTIDDRIKTIPTEESPKQNNK